MEHDNNLTGVLFFNEKKTGKQPDRRGSVTINGVEYELAGWNHTTLTGKVITRLKVKLKAAAPAAA